MGFPAILSRLQPFQICIYNRKHSKLTFSNGSQLMGKRFMANLHASLESTCNSKISKIYIRCQNWGGQSPFTMSRLNLSWKILGEILIGQMGGLIISHQMSEPGGVHTTTLDAELRNASFALISFMGFPAILSTLQPFQICNYNRKYSKLTFSNGCQLMNKRFMANLHASLESTCKSRISKIYIRCQNWGGSITFHHVQAKSELKNFRWNPGWSDGGVDHLSPSPG